MTRLSTGAAFLLLALILAGPASAHLGAQAYVIVPSDHVLPGEPFTVIVADVAPSSTVSFQVRAPTYSASLGSHVAAADGHFETQLLLPSDAPTGTYLELIGSSPDGTTVATWILVGPPTAEVGPPPTSASSRGLDPSVIVLGVLLGGAVGALGYLLLRPKRQRVEAIAAERRPVAAKRRRTGRQR